MQRYFVNGDQISGEQVLIMGEDVHHISNVMRMQIGDEVIVCAEGAGSYVASIAEIGKDLVRCGVVSELDESRELPVSVTIAQGIVKADKFDLVLQKGTECGASGFVPVRMNRSVAKIDARKVDGKVSRWRKIVKEAARQSHRQVVPEVREVVDFSHLVELRSNFDVCVFAYELSAGKEIKGALARVMSEIRNGAKVLVLVGPEGGIADCEVSALCEAGFLPVSLGPRILRTETAPIYVLSAISYALELL